MSTQPEEHSMKHHKRPLAGYEARTFVWQVSADGKIGTITLNRPERKNPLTFASYAELRDLFRALVYATDIKAAVVTGGGGKFLSGVGVHQILCPPPKMVLPEPAA